MRHTRWLTAVGAAALAFAVVAAGLVMAANPSGSQLPANKQALENYAASFRADAPAADKGKDPGRPVAAETDSPPDTGLLGPVNAPVAGEEFTPSNAWAGWTDAQTYTQVYAGGSPLHPGWGVMLVIRRPGNDPYLDPAGEPVMSYVPPPAVGGPLTILRVDGSGLIVANPGGHEFRFNPATAAFD